jgi:SAM-dependent methyltransferase
MSFDLLAPHYRWMECVLAGSKLQRCRTAWLSSRLRAENVLVLGEGNGRFLAECCRLMPNSRITCVDSSARMLQLALHRIKAHKLDSERIEFVLEDALAWVPAKRAFDLIVTHFFLDCFRADQLERLINNLAAATRDAAQWLLADFQIPEGKLCRRRAQIIHRLMYGFFRLVTRLPARRLTPPDPFLEAHGFVLRQRLVSDWGLLHSDVWQRKVGISCCDVLARDSAGGTNAHRTRE